MKLSLLESLCRNCPAHFKTNLKRLIYLAVFCVPLAVSASVTRVWTGASNANWSSPNNWNPVGEPQFGDSLQFNDLGAHQSSINDISGGQFNSISFSGTSSSYTFSGNSVELISGILFNLTNDLATINFPITLEFDQQITVTAGTLVINGGVNLSGQTLTLATSSTGFVGLGGVVSGVGNLVKTGLGTVSFGGAGNTYQGTMNISQGSAVLGKSSGNAVTGPLVVGDFGLDQYATVTWNHSDQIADTAPITINAGHLELGSFNETIGPLTLTAGDIGSNPLQSGVLTLTSPVLITGTGTNLVESYFLGTIYLATNITFDVEQSGYDPDSGDAFGLEFIGDISGPGGVVMEGCGNMKWDGVNTFSGPTIIDDGQLMTTSSQAFQGTSSVTLSNYSTLEFDEDCQFTNVTLNINSANAGIVANLVNSPCVWDGRINLNFSGGTAYCLSYNSEFDIPGSIHGTGGIIFGGEGTILLAGNNDYTGSTVCAVSLLLLNSSAGHPINGAYTVGGGYGFPVPPCQFYYGANWKATAILT
jgi:autotransporter-associated beta strand protein